MAKKSAQATPAKPAPAPTTPISAITTPSAQPSKPVTSTPASSISSSSLSPRSSPQEIALHVWNKYLQETPSRTLLLDVFMLFLVLVGALQFVYCILAGNYPFNAFLSGFSAAAGQFVLTASLRMQTSEKPPSPASNPKKPAGIKPSNAVTADTTGNNNNGISSERAFADFVFGSLILHAFCINFIN